MVVELRHVRYLLAVAEHGGFTRAAEALHVSQPTLSQQIRKMETTLGVTLVDRSGRQVRLTDVGMAFLDRAREGMRELDAAERTISDVQDLSQGALRFGVTPTFADGAVAEPLSEFTELAPAIGVTVTVAPQSALEAKVLADDLDLALGFSGLHPDGIHARPLYTEELHIVASQRRTDLPSQIDDVWLSQQRFALLSPSFATRTHVDQHFRERGMSISAALEADSAATLVQVVTRSSLLAVVPAHTLAGESGLRSIGRVDGRRVVLLHRENGYRSAAAAAFEKILLAWDPGFVHD
ncbi:LysR family cyn operon transcriptional activator [Microbacterium foliorum]|uniref:transcriptional regulator CynR n=1 Tax=Microbacterium foliorum TaxID=104336 RepID=UPI00209CE42A|nr:transcriptional regulator CynR [Microbacterium foliorum]MCP1428213.1 LysR family cyn operon transcriptional activator [Microbacterium foliorum]